MALPILKRLRFSNDEIEEIAYLIKYHDSVINETKKSVKRNFSHTPKASAVLFSMLLELQNADRLDHTINEAIDTKAILNILEEIKAANECLKVTDLAINGNDLIKLGFKGKEIGDALNSLLDGVLDDMVKNEREELLNYF